MVKRKFTEKDREFLIIANNYISQYGRFPDSNYFENALHISKQGVSNRKSRLIELEYLKGEALTHNALHALQDRSSTSELIRSYIPMPGDVSAGRKTSGELRVLANEHTDYLEESYSIPHIQTQNKIVAYHVVGDSMEDEGIFENDYVLVEVNSNQALLENKIIVTKYLFKNEDIEKDTLRGPTLKAYKGVRMDRSGRRYFVLGKRKDFGQKNPHEIEAGYLDPIGTVIAIYKPLV